MNTILHQFLLKNKFSNLQVAFDDNYESHPNYPSLFAITDTFSLLNIENVAANVPKDQLEELPNCFLAYVSNADKGNDLALIEKTKDKIGVTFDGKKKTQLSIDKFKEVWNGVIIAIEPNDKIESKTNSSFQNIAFLVLGLLGLFIIKKPFQFSLEATLSFIFYLTGFVLSIFIIQEKLNKGQEAVSKLCTFNENTSCDSVIKSAGAKINKWLDFSDLPILFFGISVLTMLIDTTLFTIINAISLISMPIVFYSIWMQKVKLKKWCVLCLMISGLLVLQSALIFSTGFELNINITGLITATILVCILWLFIKNYLENNIDLEKNNKELKRFKRNYKIFDLLKQPLKSPTRTAAFSTVEIGSQLNPIKISLALSPSCGHCHTAFEQALKVYKSNTEKTKLSVFFNLNPENKDNPYLEVAKSIMQINKKNTENVVEALSDWHIKKMSLSDWLFKWEQSVVEEEIIEDLQSQYDWCLQNNFNYTPVKMINENEYPKEYDLEELKYFISEIEEETKPVVLV